MNFIACCTALLLVTTIAHAHITPNPDTGAADSYLQTSFRVAHGCGDSATTAVHVRIPFEVAAVHPQAKPGWSVTIFKDKLAAPRPIRHGHMAEDAVTEIVWSGGKLPSEQYDEFGLLMKLPDTPGQTLWFPVLQECGDGRVEWSVIPEAGQDWHDVPTPAPYIHVTAAAKHAH